MADESVAQIELSFASTAAIRQLYQLGCDLVELQGFDHDDVENAFAWMGGFACGDEHNSGEHRGAMVAYLSGFVAGQQASQTETTDRVEELTARVARLEAITDADASGRPLWQLLQDAANLLAASGDGATVDCLRLKSQELRGEVAHG